MSLSNLSSSTGVEILTVGDANDIAGALRNLGATEATIAQAVTSFDFKKIPGSSVRRVMGGFEIGGSTLPDARIQTSEMVHNRFTKVMAANDEEMKMAA